FIVLSPPFLLVSFILPLSCAIARLVPPDILSQHRNVSSRNRMSPKASYSGACLGRIQFKVGLWSQIYELLHTGDGISWHSGPSGCRHQSACAAEKSLHIIDERPGTMVTGLDWS